MRALEALGGLAEGDLGIDLLGARELDRGEEKLTDAFVEPLRAVFGKLVRLAFRALLGDRVLDVADLANQRRERLPAVHAIGAAGRAAQHLSRIAQRGQVLGQVGEHLCAALLRALDRVPVLAHLRRSARLGRKLRQAGRFVPEDMRMAPDQLLDRAARDGAEVALAALLEQEREEVDLEQDVAQLVLEFRGIARMSGIGELVRLLDGVRDDAALVLLTIPWAVSPEPPGDGVELEQRVAQPLALVVGPTGRRSLRRQWAGLRPLLRLEPRRRA